MLLMELKKHKVNAACMQCRNSFHVRAVDIKNQDFCNCPYCDHLNKIADVLDHYEIISESPEVLAFIDTLARTIKQRTGWQTTVTDDESVIITIVGNDVFKYTPKGGVLDRHNSESGEWQRIGYDFYNTSDVIKRINSELQ